VDYLNLLDGSDVCLAEIVFDQLHSRRSVERMRRGMVDGKNEVLLRLIPLKAVDD
jgi:hypothetical protein